MEYGIIDDSSYSIWVNISAEIFPGSVSPTRSLVNRTWAGTCRILACTRTAFADDFRRPLGTFGVPSPSLPPWPWFFA